MKKWMGIIIAVCVIWCAAAFASAETNLDYYDADIVAKVKQIAAECRAQNLNDDVSIALWLHDWLIYHADYDNDAYESFVSGSMEGYEDAWSPRGVLLNGRGVCQSYTHAYGLLLDEFSIPNQEVIGDVTFAEEAHDWNLVQLGGEWYHVDVTADDPLDAEQGAGGHERHLYFGINDAMMRIDHIFSGYPACPKKLAYENPDPDGQLFTKPAYPAFDMPITDASGNTYSLASFKGEKVIYVITSIGCPWTDLLMQDLSQIGDYLTSNGVKVVLCIQNGTVYDIDQYAPNYHPDFIYGYYEDNGNLTRQINAFPFMAVKDAADNYVYYSTGYHSNTRLVVEYVNSLAVKKDLEITEMNGEYVLTKYNGSEPRVIIPPTIDGHAISALGPDAFKGDQSIISVEIPDGVTKIGSGCFQNSSIKEILLPDTLEEIGSQAFAGITMKKICIPKAASLGSEVFHGSTIGTVLVFQNSSAETFVQNNYPNFMIQYADDPVIAADMFLEYSKDGDRYIVEGYHGKPVNITVPNSYQGLPVTEIKDSAFQYCETLETITISEGIETIQAEAFGNCANLVTLNLPTTIQHLGSYIIDSCEKLTNIAIPGCRTMDVCVFALSSLETVTLPEGIEEIPDDAFGDCSNLSAVHLPSTVKRINLGAFSHCENLSSINIPNECSLIGARAFWNCTSLEAVQIPEGCSVIGESAFSNCTSLKAVNIPKECKTIGKWAFDFCTSLESIKIPEGIDTLEGTFHGCSSLTNVSLPSTLKHIGDYTFCFCNLLQDIIIPEGCETIGNVAFDSCRSLTSITIPDSVTSIGESAFNGCFELQHVKLSANLQVLEASTFWSCESLTEVTIPNSVKEIGDSVFTGCWQLKKIYIPNSVTIIDDGFYLSERLSSDPVPVIICEKDSYAYSWAKEHDYKTWTYDFDMQLITSIRLPENPAAFIGEEQYLIPALNGNSLDGEFTTIDVVTWYSNWPYGLEIEEDGRLIVKDTSGAIVTGYCGYLNTDCNIRLYDKFDLSVFNSVITLPSGLKILDEESLANTSAEAYVITSQCLIKKGAFANLPNVKAIVMPKGCTVEDGAFEGSAFVLIYR